MFQLRRAQVYTNYGREGGREGREISKGMNHCLEISKGMNHCLEISLWRSPFGDQNWSQMGQILRDYLTFEKSWGTDLRGKTRKYPAKKGFLGVGFLGG